MTSNRQGYPGNKRAKFIRRSQGSSITTPDPNQGNSSLLSPRHSEPLSSLRMQPLSLKARMRSWPLEAPDAVSMPSAEFKSVYLPFDIKPCSFGIVAMQCLPPGASKTRPRFSVFAAIAWVSRVKRLQWLSAFLERLRITASSPKQATNSCLCDSGYFPNPTVKNTPGSTRFTGTAPLAK
jgi:hypothetical protein